MQESTIESVLSCEFWKINTQVFETLKLPWASVKSKSCKLFTKCIKANPGVIGLRDCLPQLDEACRSAKVVMAKTVRFTMKQALTLIRHDPKVKVIHLVRDPRGVLQSREVTKIGFGYNVTADQLCTKILQDLKVSRLACLQSTLFFFESISSAPYS